jgi:hypothetical protein
MRKILDGDQNRAALYLRFAQVRLDKLKDFMDYAKLQQLMRTFIVDGVTVKVAVILGQEYVYINAPVYKQAGAIPAEPMLVEDEDDKERVGMWVDKTFTENIKIGDKFLRSFKASREWKEMLAAYDGGSIVFTEVRYIPQANEVITCGSRSSRARRSSTVSGEWLAYTTNTLGESLSPNGRYMVGTGFNIDGAQERAYSFYSGGSDEFQLYKYNASNLPAGYSDYLRITRAKYVDDGGQAFGYLWEPTLSFFQACRFSRWSQYVDAHLSSIPPPVTTVSLPRPTLRVVNTRTRSF